MKVKQVLWLIPLFFLTACNSMHAKQLIGAAVGNAADTQIKYGNQCFALKSQCVQGQYEEWQTNDGVEGCSCKKL